VLPVAEPMLDVAARIRASDHNAYAELFRSTHEPLIRYVYRLTGSEARALDVVQDVFLKLWEHRHQLVIHVSLRAFLYTMARNRALNMLRDESRVGGMPDESYEPAGEESDSPEAVYEIRELDQWFRRWIREMPPRRAEAFALSRFHELSNQEIGSIMGLSKRTVDTHIVHALRFLKQRYARHKTGGVRS
jgi:RNA polymerase sigma-70 factor, ECF subfamily